MPAPLYPNLPAGKYTLLITFAPRGVTQQATLPPVTLTVEQNRPL
jgi:hypothetical protein